MGSSDLGFLRNRSKMKLHYFGLMLFLVVAVNGEPKPDPKADPKPDPKAQMAIIFPGGGNTRYQDWFLRGRNRGYPGRLPEDRYPGDPVDRPPARRFWYWDKLYFEGTYWFYYIKL